MTFLNDNVKVTKKTIQEQHNEDTREEKNWRKHGEVKIRWVNAIEGPMMT